MASSNSSTKQLRIPRSMPLLLLIIVSSENFHGISAILTAQSTPLRASELTTAATKMLLNEDFEGLVIKIICFSYQTFTRLRCPDVRLNKTLLNDDG
jgi:hypothetical protein